MEIKKFLIDTTIYIFITCIVMFFICHILNKEYIIYKCIFFAFIFKLGELTLTKKYKKNTYQK